MRTYKNAYISQSGEPEPLHDQIPICCTALTLLLVFCSVIYAEPKKGLHQARAPVSIANDVQLPAGVALRFESDTYEQLHDHCRVRLTGFPLTKEELVDLELEKFEVTTPDTIIVEGTAQGDKPIPHPEVVLFKGRVIGVPDSHVVLGISPHMNSGAIRLGDRQYFLAARHRRAKAPNGAKHVIYERADMSAVEDPVGMKCYTRSSGSFVEPVEALDSMESYAWRTAFVAVETDYEYWQLFGDSGAAVAYVVQMMGTVSSFYERDLQVKLYLPYIRIWATDDCPFDIWITSQALAFFASYWNLSMGYVDRDIAQFLSGKNDKAGESDCYMCVINKGYCISAGIGHYGSYPRPPQDFHPDNYDIAVVAHEMGHNFGSPHTHCYDPPIDNCGQIFDDCNDRDIFECTPGTIMSYCGGDHCGGLVNFELRFHERVVAKIRQVVDISCLRYGINPVYVDWTNSGFEDGTIGHPFNTVAEAVHVVIPDGTVYIYTGSYPETDTLTLNPSGLIINRPVTLRTTGGMVTIGG